MLRRQLKDSGFFDLVDRYLGLRLKSDQPVSTTSFIKLAEEVGGEPLGWFFDQWMNITALPRLELKEIMTEEGQKGWHVQGQLRQGGGAAFRMPVELELVTKSGKRRHEVWIDSKVVDIDLRTESEPLKLVVDPDYEILKAQRMPPRLWWYWDQPDFILIYGTLAEAEANKAAAQRLNNWYLASGEEIIKTDTEVSEADLEKKCVMLFGRPETNRIALRLKKYFPIKIDKNKFTWQRMIYNQPSQGAAQVVENPYNARGLLILYAGLSGDAILRLFDFGSEKLGTDQFGWFPHESDASYYIYDGYKELVSGDWKDYDSHLVWKFD
jgi:hypothetical protein